MRIVNSGIFSGSSNSNTPLPPVRQSEDLIERLLGHDVAHLVGGDVALVEQALAQRLGLLFLLAQERVGHEHLGELLLVEQTGPDEPAAELVVGHGQRDALDATIDQVDEAVLVEIAYLEDTRRLLMSEELEDARQVELVY